MSRITGRRANGSTNKMAPGHRPCPSGWISAASQTPLGVCTCTSASVTPVVAAETPITAVAPTARDSAANSRREIVCGWSLIYTPVGVLVREYSCGEATAVWTHGQPIARHYTFTECSGDMRGEESARPRRSTDY